MSTVFVMIAFLFGMGSAMLSMFVVVYAIDAHLHGRMVLSTLLSVVNFMMIALVLMMASGAVLLLMDIAKKLGVV